MPIASRRARRARRRRAEQPRIPLGRRPRPLAVPGPQAPRQLAVPAPGQGHEPLGVGRQQLVRELGDRLGPREVGARHQPAQAAPAHRVARQQHEVRAALRLADPPVVLLADLAVAGKAGALGAWPDRSPLDRAGRLVRGQRLPPPRPPRPAARQRDPVRVRHGRVKQLDLDPDHRVDPGGLGGGREPDRAVQALVVRDRQPGEAQLDGPLDEVVGRRRPVEEREVGVAVQLGVGGMGHGRSPGAEADDRTDVRS